MAPTNKRTERARKNHTLRFLSRKPFCVTPQTPRRLNASHSLKPANFPSRCPHTRQGLKALLGASRRLSELISATYGSQPQKPAKNNRSAESFNNWPPSINSASLMSLVTILDLQRYRHITNNGINISLITPSTYHKQQKRDITNNGIGISLITLSTYDKQRKCDITDNGTGICVLPHKTASAYDCMLLCA